MPESPSFVSTFDLSSYFIVVGYLSVRYISIARDEGLYSSNTPLFYLIEHYDASDTHVRILEKLKQNSEVTLIVRSKIKNVNVNLGLPGRYCTSKKSQRCISSRIYQYHLEKKRGFHLSWFIYLQT